MTERGALPESNYIRYIRRCFLLCATDCAFVGGLAHCGTLLMDGYYAVEEVIVVRKRMIIVNITDYEAMN